MTAERWARVRELFEGALERDPADRDGYLRERCDGDQGLLEEVAALLDSAGEAGDYFAGLRRRAGVPPVREEPTPLEADVRLGHYEVQRILGRGGMSTVYLAHDPKHDRPVAVKVLHPELAAAIGPLRFQREIHLLARLQHPHILPVFDSGETDGRLWFVMPFVRGESLRERLRRERRLRPAEALRIAREVAQALEHAHRHGIVHRDVKPENILLAEGGEALLADFGIAIALDSGEGHLTRAGLVVGTPAYMSPEQAVGETELDGRSDQYSLACVLLEMLTGERTGVASPRTAALRAGLTPAAAGALARALDPDRDARFPTIADLARALEGGAGRPRPTARLWGALAVASLVTAALAGGGATVWRLAHRAAAPVPETADGRVRLAVLPFRNLGAPQDDYFTDGLTDEITGRLAGIGRLSVVSRTSSRQYRETDKSLRQIGGELNAGYVLEGTVQWENAPGRPGRVRVTPRLVRVSDDSHLWADRFDAEPADLFDVQSRIAERVAEALGVALARGEREALVSPPTRNLEAYDFYLRGNEYFDRAWGSEPDLRNAQEMYQRAVALDPGFAAAFARLARVHAQFFWHYIDRTDRRLALAKAAADSAVRLDTALPEAQIALGYYHYWGHRDYERALRHFAGAAQSAHDADVLSVRGAIERRQGKWREAVGHLRQAVELDPRSSQKAWDLGVAHFYLREYGEAERYFDQALAVAPDMALAWAFKAQLYLAWQGDTARTREVLRAAVSRADLGLLMSFLGDARALLLHDPAHHDAINALTAGRLQNDTTYYHLWRAEIHHEWGHAGRTRAHADSARARLEPAVRARPADDHLHLMLGLAYAYLGRGTEAIREGRRGVELLPVSRDAYWGSDGHLELAKIRMLAGDQEGALGELGYLLSIPSAVSAAQLRVAPRWAPLRRHPGFTRVLEGVT